MPFLRRIQNFILSFQCLKWVGLIVAFYFWVTILPGILMCIVPVGLYGAVIIIAVEISVPAALILQEYRRKSRIDETCKLKYKHNPNAVDEYVEMIKKNEKDA